MTGGINQLAYRGAQDIYITGNPQITYFVGIYRRYTNFSIETIPQYFNGNADFGQKIYCKLDRIGDLVNQIFLRVRLPSLKQYAYTDDQGNPVNFYWVNSIGHALIKFIEIEIGGVVIDRHYGIWYEIWSELTVDASQRLGYYEMVGKSENAINVNNDEELDLWIPLQFWFNRFIGSSLPLIALQAQEVRINVAFRDLQQLIITSNGEPFTPELCCGLSRKKNGQIPETVSIIGAYLDVDYIFLEEELRKNFAQNNHQYLIEQLQVYATQLESDKPSDPTVPTSVRVANKFQRVIMNFNHPVIELIWIFQNSDVLTIYPFGGNEWFNFSTQSYQNGQLVGKDPMINAKIVFDGKDRLEYKPAKYYRTVQNFQRHTNTPNNYIYVYSFALKPEEFQPSGSCNFSRIDDQELYIHINDELINPVINVFARNINILNIAGGMAGIEYMT